MIAGCCGSPSNVTHSCGKAPSGESFVACTSPKHGAWGWSFGSLRSRTVSLPEPHAESFNMSKKTDLKVREATRRAGGATLTKANRSAGLNKFFAVLQKVLNLQVNSFETLKPSQVRAYVDHLKKEGLKDRSIQNQLAHIRQALRAVSRYHFASSEPMSNKAMGVAGASRDGTHQALTEVQYR